MSTHNIRFRQEIRKIRMWLHPLICSYLCIFFQFYEKLAQRIEEQRNQYEAEKERELLKKFLKEKEAALEKQWQECEKLKEEAVAMACEALTRKLRAEFLIEKEQAVTEALRIAKVGVVSFSTFTKPFVLHVCIL